MMRCIRNGTVRIMTREQYLGDLFRIYTLVSVLSDKNDCKVLRVRHTAHHKDMIVRSFPTTVTAYEILYGIRTTNLPLIYDVVYLTDGQIVLEEFIEGISAGDMLECHRYTYRQAKKIIAPLCDALTVLHENGLVHRDVKPDNVMLETSGRVVLIDFNITRQLSAIKSKDTAVMGTVGYASPEQLGVTQSDARTDIYALGVFLNVLITGKHPSEQIADGKAGKIVRRCTNIHPNERYRTTQQLKASL